MTGTVYLVGAGPGAPELITVRGRELLEQAEVVVYDRLVDERLLAWANERAELIYAGKAVGEVSRSQAEITTCLIERARQGKTVVRLKGGDPFVFGRGGEEAVALAEAGVPFEIVPGVTSAVAVPAYAGVPLTHRDHASSFVVVTGHESAERRDERVDWATLAASEATLVILMGLANLGRIAERLIGLGRAAETPVAVVRNGTLPDQRTVVGTLADIAELAGAAGLTPPAIVVVGSVVGLREQIGWLERRPLFGRTVLVTRAREQASELVAGLERLGARAIELPTIRIEPAADQAPLDEAIGRLAAGGYDWAVFTSQNGVRLFWERLSDARRDARVFGRTRVAAIGAGTAAALRERGIVADLVPASYVAEGLVGELLERGVGDRQGDFGRGGGRVLLARAAGGRDVIPRGLAAAGVVVDDVELYRSVVTAELASRAGELLRPGRIDAIAFASSSTVRNLIQAVGRETIRASGAVIACIGPVTAETARELGLEVGVVADEARIPAIMQALVEHLRSR